MIAKTAFFPTDYWANYNAQDIAIIWEKKESSYFSFLPTSLTWQEFHRCLQKVAMMFYQEGVHSQSLIAYSGTDKLCGLLTYCAAIAMGAKILMLNPAQSVSQQQRLLVENGADILIEDSFFANFAQNLTTCYFFSELDFAKPATLTLTSGSTGYPKSVVHNISAHLTSAEGVCRLMQFEKNHSWLLSLPLFHVSGQGIVWRWLLKGATLYICENKPSFFEWLTRVTHASLVPTQLQRYLAQFTSLSPLKCLLGGTAIPSELVQQAQKQGMTLFSGYGMTEMASTICATQNELDNVGFPLVHREVTIEQGEIWVRGKTLALGYWQKNGIIRPLVNQLGWFQTKDRGEWDHQKRLVIKGRLDNMFISGGENIQPEEIEQVIMCSNQVEQVFVLPIEDKEFGHRPIAILQFKQQYFDEELNQLKIWLSDKLEKFKQPVAYYPLEIEKYQQQSSIKISRKQLQQDLVEKEIK